jgi:6-carboxyhexanoate--CoA ligase
MTQNNIYSIRMRASGRDRHISGAEKIVSPDKIETTVHELIARAMNRGSAPDQIIINIENLGVKPPRALTALDVITLNAPDTGTGRSAASQVLRMAGVSDQAIEAAINYLNHGAAPSGNNMRGAMIMDAGTGERLEPDPERGIRASRFDWSDEAGKSIDQLLANAGLTHFRTREALALATKVAHAPGVMAELCWSDDPDYTAGYIASLRTGYVRFPFLKQKGDERGGRAIFVDRHAFDMTALIHYLQTVAVLVTRTGKCYDVIELETYFAQTVSRT